MNLRVGKELLRQRRTELGLTRRQLAREAGVPLQTVEHAEERGLPVFDPAAYAMSLRLGFSLLDLADLSTDPADVERLGALLARATEPVPAQNVATALDWNPHRLHAAATELGNRLRPLGQAVVLTADNHLSLCAGPEILTPEQRAQLRRPIKEMDVTSARVLRTAILGRRTDRELWRFTGEDQAAAFELVGAGLLHEGREILEITEELCEALAVDPGLSSSW